MSLLALAFPFLGTDFFQLTFATKRRALVEQIRVDTGEDSRGKKEAKVIVTYRFGPSTAIGMGKDSLMPLA